MALHLVRICSRCSWSEDVLVLTVLMIIVSCILLSTHNINPISLHTHLLNEYSLFALERANVKDVSRPARPSLLQSLQL